MAVSPIGAVYLSVLPDLSQFARQAARQLSGPIRRAAEQAGDEAADALEESGEEAGERFGNAAADAAEGRMARIGTIASGVGLAAGAALASAFSGALSLDAARGRFSAQLGLSTADAEEAGKVAGSLYAKAYGDSMEEVNTAVTSVIRNLDGMRAAGRAALEQTTARALTLAEVMDADVAEVTSTVSTLLRTGLARNSREAFDLLARGAQTGANQAGDLLDVLTESASNLRQFGFTGAQAVGVLTQALQAGAPNADAFTDALEELIGNASDGIETFTALGLGGKAFADQLAGGGPRAAQALDQLLTKIRAIESPAERSRVIVELFGEEATALQGALLAVDPSTATKALGDFSGAADQAGKALHNTTASEFEAFKRQLGQEVTEAIVNDGIPALRGLQNVMAALNITPTGLVAAGAGAAALAIGYKTATAAVSGTRAVVSATSTVVKAASGPWDTLRLRAMYAGDGVRKAATGIRAGTTAAIASGRAHTANAVALGRSAVGYVRTGAAATASATRQLAAATAARVVRVATLGWTAAQWLLNAAMSANPVGLIIVGLVALGAALVLAWQKSETFRAVVMAVWQAVQAGISAAVGVIVAVVKAAWSGLVTVATVYFTIYKTIILTAWRVIRATTTAVWNGIKAALELVWKGISTVARVYIGIYTAIFRAAWRGIQVTTEAVWGGIRAVLGTTLTGIRVGFDTAVKAIGRIWAGLKEATAAPVRFVVQTVYQGGIKRIWDWLADKVGLPKLPDAPRFATGGVLPGYRPGHDSVMAMLSPGEGILRPEAVRYLGADWIHGINKAARNGQLPGYKNGGIVGAITGGVGSFFKAGKDLFMRGLVAAARTAFNPILSAAENSAFGRTGFGQIITRIPRKIVDGILSYFAKNEDEWLNKLGPSRVVKVALSQIGQGDRGGRDNNDNKYNDAFGWPPGTAWCANFVSWVLREAGAGSRYPGYPTAAVATYSGAMRKVPRSAARPGDLGFYEGAGRSHVNIVVANDGGSLTTVGGNEGPYVRKATRNDQSSIGRPNYARGGVVPRDASVLTDRDEDPADRRDPLVRLYRRLGPRSAALVAEALSTVRPMADGGLVTRPTLALVGEAGPELVVPLSSKRKLTSDQKKLRDSLPSVLGKLNPGTTTKDSINSVMKSLADQIQKAFKGGTQKKLRAEVQRAQTRLLAEVAKRDALRTRISNEQARLEELRKERSDFAGNLAGAARNFGSLTSLGTVYDASDIAVGLQDRLTALRQFTANLATLAKRGLAPGLLRQLYEAGPEQGGAYAQALVEASAKQLSEINATAAAFDSEAGKFGEQGGARFYDAGIRAAEGLVKGLQAQQAAIEKQMKGIADALVNQIKKALKIKSPSRVMAALGAEVGAGFGLGIEQATPQVAEAARALTTLPPVGRVPRPAPGPAAQAPSVRVFIGERELTDIVRVEIDQADADLARQLYTRGVA